jgi:negative regulator of sigma E activity
MKNCLDTGTIQAFLDGELASSAAAGVSEHIATCEACAAQLAAAEEESAFVFSVLEREMDTLVPTHRLWSKINDSIVVEKQNAPFWKKAWAYVTVSLANPSMVGAAALVVIFAVFAGVLINRNSEDDSASPVATVSQPQSLNPTVASVRTEGEKSRVADPAVTTPQPESERATVTVAGYVPTKRSVYNDIRSSAPKVDKAVYIPGEESYIKTIASLNQNVSRQKDSVLRPSERVSFERDMAVVDDAITKMKKEVRRNPKNESAKQVLYTSYQNKIDLLNSVSQREELVASLKD